MSLIQPIRSHQGKSGNVNLKMGAVNNSFHQVSAHHFADSRLQIAPGNILVRLPRLQHGLLAHYTLTLNLAGVESGIVNHPFSALQLHREITLILDRDLVGEHVMVLAGARVGGLVFRLHRNFDALGYFRYHTRQKYHFFLFYNVKFLPPMVTDVKMDASWKSRLTNEFRQDYFARLIDFVRKEYQSQSVYPPGREIFRAFDACPFEQVKVVVLGQDPYHGAGQANGLCFSVAPGVKPPPSLVNIFKEIRDDLGKPIPPNGDLSRWAAQGVLLLNATLTVRASSPGSHQKKGWEEFTDAVVRLISEQKEHVVFLLWGAYAQKKGAVIDRAKHLVLESAHPSPFSADRGFFGCKHFSKANAYLRAHGLQEIDW